MAPIDITPDFSKIKNWVFDLDNTLYPAACDLFAEIDERITKSVMTHLDLPWDQARVLQKEYYAKYGTTLKGLMVEHDLDPHDFLHYVHDIDHSPLDHAPNLKEQLAALPGKRIIYTNGSTSHAENVTRYMGLNHLFDDIVCISKSNYVPKHEDGAYERFIEITKIDPSESVMFEDLSRNLIPAHKLGFKTVLVTSEKDWSHEPEGVRPAKSGDNKPEHVHHVTDNLPEFLTDVAPRKQPS